MGNQWSHGSQGQNTTENRQEQEGPGIEFFTSATSSYFGPHFVVAPPPSQLYQQIDSATPSHRSRNASSPHRPLPSSSPPNDIRLHFDSEGHLVTDAFLVDTDDLPCMGTSNPLWHEVWSTVAGGRKMTRQDFQQYGNPYINQKGAACTTTLQCFVNLKKDSIRLSQKPSYLPVGSSNEQDHSLYELNFQYDASTDCIIRVYSQVKEVIVVDTRTGEPNGLQNIILRSKDNTKPTCITFGPFPPGLSKTFNEQVNIDMYHPDKTCIESTDQHVPSEENEEEQETELKEKQNPEALVFSLVIAIETLVPAMAEGLDRAAQEGMPNPINSQSTYIMTQPPNKDGAMDTRIIKQKMNIHGTCYLLQDIFGFTENEVQGNSALDSHVDNSGARDCVICMCEPRDTIVLPCRHLCVCKECAEALSNQGKPSPNNNNQSDTTQNPPAETSNNDGTSEGGQPVSRARQWVDRLRSALHHVSLAQLDPILPTPRPPQGPPKCPICRQVFHSLLHIQLPPPAPPVEGIDTVAL